MAVRAARRGGGFARAARSSRPRAGAARPGPGGVMGTARVNNGIEINLPAFDSACYKPSISIFGN